MRRLFRREKDPDASASRSGPFGPSRRLRNASALRRARVADEAVTEVIGYVLSFALSAIFLLLALNVFWAARGNTEQVTTAVELKTIADRVAARVVEMGSISQEFPNATMNITIRVPQTLNGQTYTVRAIDENVTATVRDQSLSAVATNFKLDALSSVSVWGTVDSSNERVIIQYDLLANGTKAITISGE